MRSTLRFVTLLSLTAATVAVAQAPAPPARAGGASAPAAKMLLGNTGELGLSDAQVVRLAAIARRAEARRAALRASMDSARARFTQPGDSLARRQFAQRMRADVERAREQSRTDQRDAIAVLTPDQQAKAWEMVTSRGRAMGARGSRRGGRAMQRGMRERRPMMRERMRPMMRERIQRDGRVPMRAPGRSPVPAPRPSEDM